ncbi:hypothetical protein Dimus_019796 [Dionaea muscipula]
MASPTLITPTSKSTPLIKSRLTLPSAAATPTPTPTTSSSNVQLRRRELSTLVATILFPVTAVAAAWASSDEEYVKETADMIGKVRSTINMDKNDPNVASAVAELRDASNTWVAKYRREKALLGRASFRDMYSALNAVSGHYINFGPTSPIPAKRKARILEEMDTAEKALLRGR